MSFLAHIVRLSYPCIMGGSWKSARYLGFEMSDSFSEKLLKHLKNDPCLWDCDFIDSLCISRHLKWNSHITNQDWCCQPCILWVQCLSSRDVGQKELGRGSHVCRAETGHPCGSTRFFHYLFHHYENNLLSNLSLAVLFCHLRQQQFPVFGCLPESWRSNSQTVKVSNSFPWRLKENDEPWPPPSFPQ